MIKINLLGDDTSIDTSSKRIAVGFVASLLVVIGIFYFISSSMNAEIGRLAEEIRTKE